MRHDNFACYQIVRGEVIPADGDWTWRKEKEHERSQRRVAVVLTVFGDESSDETGSRVFAVAGVIGRQEEWDELEKAWLKRTGGIIFHAADCDSDKGDFENTGHENNKKLYKDLTNILVNTRLLGHGVAIDLAGYRSNFPNEMEESAYFMCFTRIIIRFAQLASVFIPQDKVKFIFDIRHQVTHNAGLLYDRMSNFTRWDIHSYMDEISFQSSKNIGIQVADLWARETMKHLDNIVGPKKRLIRKSMDVLSKTGRFKTVYYMKEFYDGLKENTERLGDNASITRPKYEIFLRERNLQDNMTNRIIYVTETNLSGLFGND